MRGADGYLLPYTDDEVRQYANETFEELRRLPVAQHRLTTQRLLPPGITVAFYTAPESADSLGPILYWIACEDRVGLAGAGRFERDTEWEQEDGGTPSWIEQGAYILPKYQRRGIYTAILRLVSRVGEYSWALPVLPDTQQTEANARCWAKIARK